MAWFAFTDASGEAFVVRLDDPELMAHARALVAGDTEADARIGGTVVKEPVGYNPAWSFHLDPNSVFFFEMSTEVGDSTMRYIEAHLPEVGGHLLPGSVWTGWSSTLTAELAAQGGGNGADQLRGDRGADLLMGRAGGDLLLGCGGDDHISGGAGTDRLGGGRGSDRLGGGTGRDLLLGGAGRDTLDGGSSADWLYGGTGADRLDGGLGSDFLRGGRGADTFALRPGGGTDRVSDFEDGAGAGDVIDLTAFGLSGFGDVLVQAEGDNLLLSSDGEDAAMLLVGYLEEYALSNLGADDFIL